MWILLAPFYYLKYRLQQALWPKRKPGSQVSNLPLLQYFGPHVRDDPLTVSSHHTTLPARKNNLIFIENTRQQSRTESLLLARTDPARQQRGTVFLLTIRENSNRRWQGCRRCAGEVKQQLYRWFRSRSKNNRMHRASRGGRIWFVCKGERGSEWGRNKIGVSENTNYMVPIKKNKIKKNL